MATVDDLRAVLSEHSAQVPQLPGLLAGVHDRVRRDTRRRRTLAGAALALVALVVAGGAVLLPGARTASDRTVAGRPGVDAYYGGGALLATATATPQRRTATFSFTPTDWQLTLRTVCAPDVDAQVAVQVNGRPSLGGGCGGAGSGGLAAETFWRGLGVALGRPSTVTLTVTSVGSRSAGPVHVAVYQRVPVSDYPLPARPATLAPLAEVGAGQGWDARRLGADGTTTRTVTIDGATELEVMTVAPGAVQVTVAGRVLGLAESWDWNANGFAVVLDVAALQQAGIAVQPGDGIDVTVTASRFTVPGWTVAQKR